MAKSLSEEATMATIIPLFIEDELTGLPVPNTGCPEDFIVVNSRGEACSIHRTRNDGIAWIHTNAEPGVAYAIDHCKGSKPVEVEL
jgi:hypothetical protein